MPLVSSLELLLDARGQGYAIGAFNVENMEMAQGVVLAAERMRAPVIIQTTSGTLKYASPATYVGLVRALAEASSAQVALHLDHGSSAALARTCIEAGYTSVMIDGSTLSFEENIALSREVARFAHEADVPVEAELGMVGGKEDGMGGGAQYTQPDKAARFVRETGVDALAVAIGTAHGIYKGVPKLDIQRLREIHALVSIPLVLHGTSGVPEDAVRACIREGICKVNYATDLRIAFTDAVKAAMAEKPEAYDPKHYLAAGREAVAALVAARIELLGSAGRL